MIGFWALYDFRWHLLKVNDDDDDGGDDDDGDDGDDDDDDDEYVIMKCLAQFE